MFKLSLKHFFTFLCFLFFLTVVSSESRFSVLAQNIVETLDKRFALKIYTDKTFYLPGEPVTITFKISNTSNQSLGLYKGYNVEKGYMHVYISKDNKNYLEYVAPGWGLEDTMYTNPIRSFAPGESITSQSTILYNPMFGWASPPPGRLPNGYAFPAPGDYYIKASLKDEGKSIESISIKILIKEPEDVDLIVWEALKDNKNDIGFFLHEGGFLNRSPQVINEQLGLLESIVQQYPESSYSNRIRKLLLENAAPLKD